MPATVVLSVVVGLRVARRTPRVDEETETGLSVAEQTQHQAESVAAAATEIPPELIDDQALRLVVVHHGANVERRVVIEEAYFGLSCRELSLLRRLLIELVRRLGPLPHRLIQTAVDDDRFFDTKGLHVLGGSDLGVVLAL